ncbi:MAG: hypothetical protein ACT4PT_14405, partial [Methanobacteriota archaeon]
MGMKRKARDLILVAVVFSLLAPMAAGAEPSVFFSRDATTWTARGGHTGIGLWVRGELHVGGDGGMGGFATCTLFLTGSCATAATGADYNFGCMTATGKTFDATGTAENKVKSCLNGDELTIDLSGLISDALDLIEDPPAPGVPNPLCPTVICLQ